MTDAKHSLLPLLPTTSALTFGTYTLKSGRQSPYFFNSSLLYTASLHHAVCSAYASVLTSPPFTPKPQSLYSSSTPSESSNSTPIPVPTYDVLFGPAYKGIVLSGSILPFLLLQTQDTGNPTTTVSPFNSISYAYNRKEPKPHGEGGSLVGCPVKNKRVVIVDDVITAGTAIREAVNLIRAEGGIVVGVVVLLDRQERVSEEEPRSALGVASEELGVPVKAVIRFEDLIGAVEEGRIPGAGEKELRRMKEYREKYRSRD
ncbi:hypothetical protein GJ744_007657 [Endocarpon pusillum]|uniref:orotate phosphoribosyltransferase n=1 Tax=Endocarpon pusillum TaxID=364733 RepID=A0A8H7E3Y8_9EURO|nr:hypothetical protein GJ744_007657 [Endocarpon pusillum]